MSMRDKIAKAILGGKTGGPTPTGIHVYHSSPHDFDRFDLSKIGTGEGAQVYGHGIYAAENPAVSGQGGHYWQQFAPRFGGSEAEAISILKRLGFDRDQAIAKLGSEAGGYIPGSTLHTQLNEAKRLLESGAPVGPRTYEVNFRAKPEELLDWDRRLDQQSPHVRETVAALTGLRDPFVSGKTAYQDIKGAMYQKYGNRDHNINSRYASETLAEGGIPGIRYLDEGSRVTGPAANNFAAQFGSRPEAHAAAQRSLALASDVRDVRKWEDIVADLARPQTHDYVAFDPSKLDIMAKYGVIGATGGVLGAGAMGGTIDQSTYGDRQ